MIRWYISNFVTWYWSLINGSLLILRSMLMLRTISTGLDASHWDWWMGSCANITMRNGQETRVCVWASFLEIFEELISFEVHTKLQFILEPVELHIQIRKRRATVDCYSFVAWLFFLWWIWVPYIQSKLWVFWPSQFVHSRLLLVEPLHHLFFVSFSIDYIDSIFTIDIVGSVCTWGLTQINGRGHFILPYWIGDMNQGQYVYGQSQFKLMIHFWQETWYFGGSQLM